MGSICYNMKLWCGFWSGNCFYNINCNFFYGMEELWKFLLGWEEFVVL